MRVNEKKLTINLSVFQFCREINCFGLEIMKMKVRT